ncbi:carbohydrate ABC transporter permease [Paenibacillus mesotrionivorans]|uniref:Carbohydrate ABC transporter permease n=1 Tax=Paenibacillus mesotrionivorans TaxID=3160968 RepID=A0ACC7P3Q8_9BACL
MEHRSLSGRLFEAVNLFLLGLIALITILPFVNVVAVSFATPEEYLKSTFMLFPTKFSLEAYKFIFSTSTVSRSLIVTVGITLVGTMVSMVFTSCMAYGLARRDLGGRRVLMFLVVFTILFNGGMIPSFMIVKQLGLINSYGALIIPSAVSAFNLIIMRNFFMGLPDGLEESAKIDGCNDIGILFRIVLPLSKAVLASVGLFYAVGYWNTFMQAVLFIDDYDKWPIQVLLRQIVIMAAGLSTNTEAMSPDYVPPPEQTIKMAVIVVATVPVLLVYPFLQKHFAKGALLGSIKG